MEQNSKFFENKLCEYYPCHKDMKEMNCLFCYCPFYAWPVCPGKNSYLERKDGKRVKVCSDCRFPHVPENYEKMMELLCLGMEDYANMREAEMQKN